MSIAVASNERLTWQQMTERYPGTWVGLTDVVREPDGITVESAVVAIAGDKHTVVGGKLCTALIDTGAIFPVYSSEAAELKKIGDIFKMYTLF